MLDHLCELRGSGALLVVLVLLVLPAVVLTVTSSKHCCGKMLR